MNDEQQAQWNAEADAQAEAECEQAESESELYPSPCSPLSFHLTQEQTDRFSAWAKGRIGHGPIGGRITVSFTGTSIGTVVKVKDQQTGEEIDLSDYEDW